MNPVNQNSLQQSHEQITAINQIHPYPDASVGAKYKNPSQNSYQSFQPTPPNKFMTPFQHRSPKPTANSDSDMMSSSMKPQSNVDEEMDGLMRQIEELKVLQGHQSSHHEYNTLEQPKHIQTSLVSLPKPEMPVLNTYALAYLLDDNMVDMVNTKGIGDLLGSALQKMASPENRAAIDQSRLNEL